MEYLCTLVRPSWKEEVVLCKKLSGGYVNQIYKCSIASDPGDEQSLVVRIFTEKIANVDHDKEVYGMQIAHAAGVAEPLYIIFNNGLVYGYATGNTAKWGMLWDDKMARNFMRTLAKLNLADLANIPVEANPDKLTKSLTVFEKLRKAIHVVPEIYKHYPERTERVKHTLWNRSRLLEEADLLERFIKEFDFPLAFAQNDAWMNNFIYDSEKDRLSLVDFECFDTSYEASDVAFLLFFLPQFETLVECFGAQAGPSEDEMKLPRSEEHRKKLIRFYLEEKAMLQGRTPEDITQQEFGKFCVQVDVLETLHFFTWSVIIRTLSDDPVSKWDFLALAERRHELYLERRAKWFSMEPF